MVYQPGAVQITAPNGSERFFPDNGGPNLAWLSLNSIFQFGTTKAKVYNTSALAAAGALTAANITGANDTVFLEMTGAFAAAENIELPTVASVVAALSQQQGVNSTFVLRIINPSAETLTITENAGWVFGGTGSYALLTETFRDFLITITSATTATFQEVGGGSTTNQ